MTMLLFALAAAIGLAYGVFLLSATESLPRAVVKILPLALLAFAAWPHGGLALVAALALSAAGDFFLAFRGERFFLAGLASFLLAHLAYAWLFSLGQDPQWAEGPVFLAGALLIFAFAIGVFRRLQPHLGAMKLPVSVYVAAIAAMAVAAWSRGPEPVLIAGVVAFMASDTALAFETFVLKEDAPARRWTRPFVWFAYLCGQLLIAAAFLLS